MVSSCTAETPHIQLFQGFGAIVKKSTLHGTRAPDMTTGILLTSISGYWFLWVRNLFLICFYCIPETCLRLRRS